MFHILNNLFRTVFADCAMPPSSPPLQAEIIRSSNVQCLSFPLTVATFFTSTSWVLYGLQLNDYYITVKRR